MKRYQLMGRKGKISSIPTPKYGPNHIHSMPYEILMKMFNLVKEDINTLVSLSLTCKKFHTIIVKNLLYKTIKFTLTRKFLAFKNTHLPNKRHGVTDTSTKVNLIQNLEIVNPPVKDRKDSLTIAGSYSIESGNELSNAIKFDDFSEGLGLLIKNDYNLKTIVLSEMSPQFLFNDMEVESILKWYKKREFRKLNRLVLKSQNGWSILFVLNRISKILDSFDTIEELELHNFLIDETVLLNIKLEREIYIKLLKLVGCSFQNRLHKLKPCDLFKHTQSLQLYDLKKTNDLSIVDLIKRNNILKDLTIDLNSDIFYKHGQFNFKVFNPFFKLVCSKTGYYANLECLTLYNIDLFDLTDHVHESDIEDTQCMAQALKYVSKIGKLTLIVKERQSFRECKKCGIKEAENNSSFHTLSDNDWKNLLNPLIKSKTKFEVFNCNNELLYEQI